MEKQDEKEILKYLLSCGKLLLLLDVKLFKFTSSTDGIETNLGIILNISNDEIKNDHFSLQIQKQIDGPITMTLSEIDSQRLKVEVLKLSIDDNSNTGFTDLLNKLDLDILPSLKKIRLSSTDEMLEIEQCNVMTSVQQQAYISIIQSGNLIEVIFIIQKYESYKFTLITNPKANIEKTKNILWNNFYLRFGSFINGIIISDTMRFIDCDVTKPIIINIAEKCHMINRSSNDTIIIIPWNNDCLTMVKQLSLIIGIDMYGIRLFDERGMILHENIRLDIEQFRTLQKLSLYNDLYDGFDNTAPIHIYYNISSVNLHLKSIQDDSESLEIVIPEECLISELKERLSSKLDIDKSRIMLFRKEEMLTENMMVSTDDEVIYLVASRVESDMEFVSQGSFGRIFKCSLSPSAAPVALKELKLPSNEISFIREFLVLTKLQSHPNIVQYLNIFVKDNIYLIGMEYEQRGSLRNHLKINGPLKHNNIKAFTYNILLGLKYLHDNKIIHRDIKGANILLGDNNIAKLCDFGLSRILTNSNTQQLSEGVTLTAECGSIRWMAPEVINGEKYALKADIWSVGATVVEMITGKVPYDEYEDICAFFKIGSTKKIDFISPEPMSVELKEFVDVCLKPSSTDRPDVNGLLNLAFITN